MSEEAKEKVGKLTYVAKTGGLHLDNSSKWENPANEVKEKILQDIDKIKEKIGCKVRIRLDDKGYYRSIEVLEEKQQEQKKEEQSEEQIMEEDIDTSQAEPEKKEEKEVSKAEPQQASEKKEDIADMKQYFRGQVLGCFGLKEQEWDKEYFEKLNKQECPTEKKNNLTYISWAHAWEALKKLHPDAAYEIHENRTGMPYFYDKTGAFVKVSVTVCGLTHTVHLPVMDYMNKSIKVEQLTTFDTNKAIQRALAKAIAMHGLGLYVYRGEDLPEESK